MYKSDDSNRSDDDDISINADKHFNLAFDDENVIDCFCYCFRLYRVHSSAGGWSAQFP